MTSVTLATKLLLPSRGSQLIRVVTWEKLCLSLETKSNLTFPTATGLLTVPADCFAVQLVALFESAGDGDHQVIYSFVCVLQYLFSKSSEIRTDLICPKNKLVNSLHRSVYKYVPLETCHLLTNFLWITLIINNPWWSSSICVNPLWILRVGALGSQVMLTFFVPFRLHFRVSKQDGGGLAVFLMGCQLPSYTSLWIFGIP